MATELFFGPRTPNDDRSDSMNPNNSTYQDEMDNQSNQQNPNNEHYNDDYNSTK